LIICQIIECITFGISVKFDKNSVKLLYLCDFYPNLPWKSLKMLIYKANLKYFDIKSFNFTLNFDVKIS